VLHNSLGVVGVERKQGNQMRKLILMLMLLSIPSLCFAQGVGYAQKATSEDRKASIYIPANLEECFVELKKTLTPEQLTEFKNKKGNELADVHFGLGMWIRNNWGLWQKSRLAKYE